MAKEQTTRYYRLARPYWNNRAMCPKGSIQPFVEGTQPKTAVLVTSSEMEAMSAAEKAVSVQVDLPEGFYEDVVAEVLEQVMAALQESSKPAAPVAPSSAEGGSTSADPKVKK